MGERIRVATFNIRTSRGRDGRDRWRRRRPACLACIRGLDAGVVGRQEVRPDQRADLVAGSPRATVVRLRRGRQALGVVNTHFDHRGTVARLRSAQLISERLARETDRPWVGDLNDVPGSAPLRALEAAGLRDALPVDARRHRGRLPSDHWPVVADLIVGD